MGDNVVLARNVERRAKCPLSSQTVVLALNNISAQLGIDPATGKLVEGGVLSRPPRPSRTSRPSSRGIDHVLNDVVRLTVFVKDIRDMDDVDEVQKMFFRPTFPRAPWWPWTIRLRRVVQIGALLTNGEGTIRASRRRAIC